jgi:hypothetical protein
MLKKPIKPGLKKPVFLRRDAARRSRNQSEFNKEARKPGFLSGGSWFPGFLIKNLRGM